MIIVNIEGGATAQSPRAPLSIALGNFDGVHVGHARLLERAVRHAKEAGCVSAAWTFDGNPFGVPYITSTKEKLELFEAAGIGCAIVCRFDAVREKSPAEFADMLASLGAVHCVCGFNYTFGAGGAGDADALRSLLGERGIGCEVADPVILPGDDLPVSSTRIREALAAGDVEAAARMLGRPYSFTYPVTHGNEIGRAIGFPTVNQKLPPDRAALKRGVYVCRCLGHAAVTNVGTRPTVCDSDEVICETHIIGYEGDLYGVPVEVDFLKFIRDERKFASLDELKARLAADVEIAQSRK